MQIFTRIRAPLLAGIVFTFPQFLCASPSGTLDIAGLGVVHFTVSTIDFGPIGSPFGDVVVTGRQGSYTAIASGSTATIFDLSDPPATAGPPLATPITPFLIVPNPGPVFAFNLEQIFRGGGDPCTVAPAIGHSCTPSEILPNSPLLLTQKQSSVSVSFSVRGTVVDLRDGTSSSYVGLITANLTSLSTVPQVLAALSSPGFVESSWSAEFTSPAFNAQVDNTPPVISGLPGPGCIIWPPNQNLIQVATVTATDADSGVAPGSFTVTGTSNEPFDPKNPDVLITPNGSGGFNVQLRADRLGNGTGRVYALTATASDLAGNTTRSTTTCTVPHDQGH